MDYYFIIKELAEEFKKQFNCLREYTEKYITFTVPIEKEVMEKKLQKIYLTYINMYYSLLKVQDLWQVPYLANNLSEGIHRIK